MRWSEISGRMKGSFAAKSLLNFTLLFWALSLAFAAFFIVQQHALSRQHLAREGEMMARLLAQNCRLGVFYENPALLRETLENTLREPKVVGVSVFSATGKDLLSLSRRVSGEVVAGGGSPPRGWVSDPARETVIEEGADSLRFWAPVFAAATFPYADEFLDAGTRHASEAFPLGYVSITVSKMAYKSELTSLLTRGLMLATVLLAVGFLVVWGMVRRITQPLNRLTANVNALGKGETVERIPVEAADEVGRLAVAFNEMNEALRARQSEKDLLEEQLRQSQKMEAIGTLTGGIAHDFNNLLTIINGYGDLVMQELDEGSQARDHMKKVLAAGAKASGLTSGLLTFSRKQWMSPRAVDLNDHVQKLGDLLLRMVGEKIQMKVDLKQGELAVQVDPGQMDQVILNLVTNARDAMPEGGVLSVSTGVTELDAESCRARGMGRPGKQATLRVSDTGVGMNEQILARVFDPFFTTKEVGKGTGLGLSIVYGIVKQHDGVIVVESAVGKGSTFLVYLPLLPAGALKPEPGPPAPGQRGTETVLLAEDDQEVRTFIKALLESHGYRVIEAADGKEAVAEFARHPDEVQLLLLDIVMPRMNGRQAYHEIRRVKPGIRALFISGYTTEVDDRKLLLEEGLTILHKPVNQAELLAKLRGTLDSRPGEQGA